MCMNGCACAMLPPSSQSTASSAGMFFVMLIVVCYFCVRPYNSDSSWNFPCMHLLVEMTKLHILPNQLGIEHC